MATLHRPAVDDLSDVLAAMVGWPRAGQPVPLHVGDLG